MHLSITTLTILEDITRDAAGAAHVELELRGSKSSVIRIFYANGGERIRLAWDDQHCLTPECSGKVLRAIRDDARLTSLLNDILWDEATQAEPETPDLPNLSGLAQRAAPPTMFL